MNVVFLGATRGMGRALARRMAARGDRLFLLGRDPDDLQRTGEDLAVRAGSDTLPGLAWCDLERPDGFDDALDAAWASLETVDCVVISAGLFATQDALEADPELCLKLLRVDYAHTVYLCERVRERLLAGGGGTLCVFSSVAGDRGRKPVGLYGSAKAGLSHYLESLDHRYRARGLVTVCVKPGFVRTGMTEGLKPPPFAGEPEAVAAQVLAAIDGKRPLVYAPSVWRLVMLVIRHLPRFVMRQVGF